MNAAQTATAEKTAFVWTPRMMRRWLLRSVDIEMSAEMPCSLLPQLPPPPKNDLKRKKVLVANACRACLRSRKCRVKKAQSARSQKVSTG